MKRTDVCVVGGGVIGLAVAWELARRGREVVVLEAGRLGERAAASVAAGMLAPASEADLSDPRLTALALASHARYPDWAADLERASGLGTGFDRTGTLFVALHRDHLALLEHLEAFQRERGLRTRRLGAAQVRDREPLLAPSLAGALHLEDDYQVDPRRLLRALAEALRRAGGEAIEHRAVRAVTPRGDGFEVASDGDDGADNGSGAALVAREVVLAGGAWTGEVESPAPPLPMRPVKGQVVRLRGEPMLRHVVRTPDVYLVPRADGEVVVGGTMEEHGFDARPMAGAVYDLLREAWRVLPGVYELEFAETNVGFRPALRDHMPAIGEAGVPGLFVAAGHFRNGVELAPMTAHLLADLMCEGRRDALLEPLSPLRFAGDAVVAEVGA